MIEVLRWIAVGLAAWFALSIVVCALYVLAVSRWRHARPAPRPRPARHGRPEPIDRLPGARRAAS